MVNVYGNLRDENDNDIPGRCTLFITKTDDKGNINECLSGIAGVPMTNGTMFIVDEWLIDQLDKVQFIDGTLKVKDGEELTPPVKSEKELQREALLKQLAELDSQPSE
ncbi:hypothetical protein [Jeotgalicoccus marinus]|uniref:hypothetical protein n=1 Tax=Jeotgalicoccus marinus TaxID=516700 RepID=UPI00041981BA|nr:hypothetical protein [Jeotgalicoccus marinus]